MRRACRSCNMRGMGNTRPRRVSGPHRSLVQLRSRMTADEYHRLRVHAVSEQRDIADLVADALRAAYPLTEGTK